MMEYFDNLREANKARAKHWGEGKIDIDWRLNELAGETGEVCNVLKKLHRESLGVPGSRATREGLCDELADVLICLDLFLIDVGNVYRMDVVPLFDSEVLAGVRVPGSLPRLGMRLYWHVASIIDKYLERISATTNQAPLVDYLEDTQIIAGAIIGMVQYIAITMEVHDIESIVQTKFNKTSEANGLPVKIGGMRRGGY